MPSATPSAEETIYPAKFGRKKSIINNSHVMHYMPFWITDKTCNNTPDFREGKKKERKRKKKKKSFHFSTEAKATLVNETRIVGTEKSETRKTELQSWNKNGEDGLNG